MCQWTYWDLCYKRLHGQEFTIKATRENNPDNMNEPLLTGHGINFEVGKMEKSN